jgi:hypothetical protein
VNVQKYVEKSSLPNAGNGLFAERDYGFGELITYYRGKAF